MKNIIIIGAGFSGVAVTARLLRKHCNTPMRVLLVNGSGRIARGMAYGTQSLQHVLNVPAGNMSAFEEEPNHFLKFVHRSAPDTMPSAFVSRRLYGDYLEWLLSEAELAAPEHIELKRIYRQVERIDPMAGNDGCMVTLDDGETISVDKVVLALGHFPATHPRIDNLSFYDSPRYLHDPWDHARLDAIPARAPVLLLGTGLTAVDVATTLMARNPARQIIAVSRRGLLPQAHRHIASAPSGSGVRDIWNDASTVRAQLRGLRQYCRGLEEQGRDWREALSLLRHVTSDVWLAYSDRERRRFLRHVQPYWDTHRHRLAPEVAQRFSAALSAGVMTTLAGRVLDFEDDGDSVRVSLRPRGSDQLRPLRVQYVINCTGPCADARRTNSVLVQQLLGDDMMRTDKLGLGIDVTTDYSVVSATGEASRTLFYIGPWLKAKYWEATAVPDLRVMAAELASRIMRDMN